MNDGSVISEENNLISNDIGIASNEYLTKFSVNRNFVKLLSNDYYLMTRVKDDESIVYSYNCYKTYKLDDLVFFKTSLSSQNTYLLCSITSDNNFAPSCSINAAGQLVVVNDDHWKMVGVPVIPDLSGYSPTDKAYEYISTSREYFYDEHQNNTNTFIHPLGPFGRKKSSVLFSDLTNLSKERSTLFYPYKVQKLTPDDTILDGYMRKWDNGILEYDIVFRVGYQGKSDEGYDMLEANNISYIHRNMNYMYFKNRKDYGIFNQGGKIQALVNNQRQTNLNDTINAYVGQIVFPDEFKDLNYMIFSSNTKSITTRTYNTKNDIIPYEQIDNRLSVVGLTLTNHVTLSSTEDEKRLYDTPINVHISVQNIAEDALAYIDNRYSRVEINILSNSNITNIDDRAFFKTSLTSINIPFSTRHIGTQAFAKCSHLKHINFYVEQNPALHPKIELCAFGQTPELTSISIIYKRSSFQMFETNVIDDPEVSRLSTYNDDPLEVKLMNDLIRTHIYGISQKFDPDNINVIGKLYGSFQQLASENLEYKNNFYTNKEKDEDFITIDAKNFLERFKYGNLASSKKLNSSMTFAAVQDAHSLTTYFKFNDDKTELIGWNRDTLTNYFEFDSMQLLEDHECSTVTSIADFALSGCNMITGFTAGCPLVNIGYASLSGCMNLNQITISDSVTNICDYAFSDCNIINTATISCSIDLTISQKSFSDTIISVLNILPNSIVKANSLPITANFVCADMSGSFFKENSMHLAHLTTFCAHHISASRIDESANPPISGFSFNSFSGCDIRKFIAEDEEIHDISGIFERPYTIYSNVNPHNVVDFKDKTLIQFNYAEHKDKSSQLTCISSDGNIYIRKMRNDDWVYEVTTGSISSEEIVGFFYGDKKMADTQIGWAFLIGSLASQMKHIRNIIYVGQVVSHGVDDTIGGYYIYEENLNEKIPALLGSFILENNTQYILYVENKQPIWIEIGSNSENRIIIPGIHDSNALKIYNIYDNVLSSEFNAYREVWSPLPVTQLTSIVLGDSICNIPNYFRIGDDYSIISCNMNYIADMDIVNNCQINIISSFTMICSDAFSSNGLYSTCAIRKIEIPNTISSIGDNAFKGNLFLSCLSVQAGTDLQYFGHNAINGCALLESFELKATNVREDCHFS